MLVSKRNALTSRRLSFEQVAMSLAKTSPVTALALFRVRGRGTAHCETNGGFEGRGGEGAIEAAPFGQRRPVGQPATHGRRRIGPYDFKKPWARRL